MTTPQRAGRVERFDTVVIGGGQAGLAAGHHLAARDIDSVILTEESRVGDNWRRRWDSLRLFTPAAYSGLPGLPFPASPSHLADKDEVADYLERYAERFDLPVRPRSRVEKLSWDGEHFVLEAGDSVLEAKTVVVATGPFQKPRLPSFAAHLSTDIHQLHSSQYRNPWDLPDGPALVVGAGNSGAQIALELARFRKVWLSGRDTGHMPRRLLGRDIFDWLWPVISLATADRWLGQALRTKAQRGGDALIGIPEEILTEAGVVRLGRLAEERAGWPVCGGEVVQSRVIVWSTGFAPDYGWLDLPVFGDDGYPRHRRGVATDTPGLYFLGLRFQHRMSSSLIGGVGADAQYIAEQIAGRLAGAELG